MSLHPQPDPGAAGLVFVDLDRCLLNDDSIGAFLAWLVDRGMVPPSALLRGAVAYLAYRLNWADPEMMIRRGVEKMAGFREADLDAEAESFFNEIVRFRYRRSVVEEIERHQAAGAHVFLLTGGLPYVPRRVAADLGIDGACASEAEVIAGHFSGRILDPPCVGAGKIVHADRAARSVGQELTRAWFYSDSYSDLPMLELAAVAVAVNPDSRLRRVARKRGWRVVP